jgi:hypothetical protein
MKPALFDLPEINPPGTALQKEMFMNTILPLLESMRKEKGDKEPIYSMIRKMIENCTITQAYGTVKRFHDQHGIDTKDRRQRNWLISQGVLSIRDNYCSQGMQLNCPICLMEEAKNVFPK